MNHNTSHTTADREEFITAMRAVASSVAVITTDGPGGRHGATASAFCSVSADPPTVLVCLRAESKIARMVSENGLFNVNVLSAGLTSIADRFAGVDDAWLQDRFDGIECQGQFVPAIGGATVFCCAIDNVVQSGSHNIFIGKVTDLVAGSDHEPLAYHDGAYHRVVRSECAAK